MTVLFPRPNFKNIEERLNFGTNLGTKGQRYYQMTFIFLLKLHLVHFFSKMDGFRWF